MIDARFIAVQALVFLTILLIWKALLFLSGALLGTEARERIESNALYFWAGYIFSTVWNIIKHLA